jgi:hypothetical protein
MGTDGTGAKMGMFSSVPLNVLISLPAASVEGSNCCFQGGLEEVNLSLWPSYLAKEIRGAVWVTYIVHGGLCPKSRQSGEDEHPLAGLYSEGVPGSRNPSSAGARAGNRAPVRQASDDQMPN